MRAKKNGEFVNVKIEQPIADDLNRYIAETGLSKTAVVENALRKYFADPDIIRNLRGADHE